MTTVAPFVTLVRATDKEQKKFTIELYSETAEDAYLKEKTLDNLFKASEAIESVELIGTYKKVQLKIVGE